MNKFLGVAVVSVFVLFNVSYASAAAEVSYSVNSARDEVYSNNSASPDFPFWTQNINGKPSVGYLIFKDIKRTDQIVEPKITKFLRSGVYKTKIQSDAFDARGRWLGGIYDDGSGTLRGFYHAEAAQSISCDKISGIKSIAYAESKDGGLTWEIPSYPNNSQIITGQYPEGAGDLTLREFNGYLYIYYYEAACGVNLLSQGTAVARSPISSKGKPGSWMKYYCDSKGCDFKSPALGGKFTRPSFNGSASVNIARLDVSWNDYLEKYIASASVGGDSVLFVTSTDLVNWKLIQPVYHLPQFTQQNTIPAYRSVLSLTGDMGRTGQSFWLYYVGVNRTGRSVHTLYRQRVTLSKKDGVTVTPTTVPLKGDANNDGKVDGVDFTTWLLNYGKDKTGSSFGDFNTPPDGKVDGMDYVIWLSNYRK